MSTEFTERHDVTSFGGADIRVSEVIWPKAIGATRADKQQNHLINLVNTAGTGLILDCTLVEIGNSEIISLLMRVRNHAKKRSKEIALFNVPDTLSDIIRICNLRSVLPVAEDSVAAKKLVHDLSRGKGRWRLWLKAHRIASALAGSGACVCGGAIIWFVVS
jgi:anti-anti-sigma factor